MNDDPYDMRANSVYKLREELAFALTERDALRAANARLRAALKPFADKAEFYSEWADTARDAVWFPISDLRAARAARGETE